MQSVWKVRPDVVRRLAGDVRRVAQRSLATGQRLAGLGPGQACGTRGETVGLTSALTTLLAALGEQSARRSTLIDHLGGWAEESVRAFERGDGDGAHALRHLVGDFEKELGGVRPAGEGAEPSTVTAYLNLEATPHPGQRRLVAEVTGTPAYVTRVEQDLDRLASTHAGGGLLDALHDAHAHQGPVLSAPAEPMSRSSAIQRTLHPELTWQDPTGENPPLEVVRSHRTLAHPEGTSNDLGVGATSYQLTYDYDRSDIAWRGQIPSEVTLQHELAHLYDVLNHTRRPGEYHGVDLVDIGQAIRERQAVGLPIDHDLDPTTPEIIDPNHPYWLTENGLRFELGLPVRQHYNE